MKKLIILLLIGIGSFSIAYFVSAQKNPAVKMVVRGIELNETQFKTAKSNMLSNLETEINWTDLQNLADIVEVNSELCKAKGIHLGGEFSVKKVLEAECL